MCEAITEENKNNYWFGFNNKQAYLAAASLNPLFTIVPTHEGLKFQRFQALLLF